MRTIGMTCMLVAWGLFACVDLDRPSVELELGDEASFTTDVQSYLGAGCGSLACHGDLGRSFRLHAEFGLRLNVSLRNQPISREEIFLNLQSIAALSPGNSNAEEHLLLLKALGTGAGGFAHEGGVIWENTEDDGYKCIFAWLEGQAADLPGSCTLAYERVKPADIQ